MEQENRHICFMLKQSIVTLEKYYLNNSVKVPANFAYQLHKLQMRSCGPPFPVSIVLI